MKQETKKKIAIVGITTVLGICAITGTTSAIIQNDKKITANAISSQTTETTLVAVIGDTKYFRETVTTEQGTYTLQQNETETPYIWTETELGGIDVNVLTTGNGLTIGNLIKEEYNAQNFIYVKYGVAEQTMQTGRFKTNEDSLETIEPSQGKNLLIIIYNPQEQEPPKPTTNNITESLYNLIWNTFFSGTLPEPIQNCAEEICTIMTIGGIALGITLPLIVMFGLIKWIWNFVR